MSGQAEKVGDREGLDQAINIVVQANHAFTNYGITFSYSRMKPFGSVLVLSKLRRWLWTKDHFLCSYAMKFGPDGPQHQVACTAPRRLQRSSQQARDQSYIAVVYEYVEEAANEPAAVEAVTSFLWLAGFSHSGSQAQKLEECSSTSLTLPTPLDSAGNRLNTGRERQQQCSESDQDALEAAAKHCQQPPRLCPTFQTLS